jgi:membrane protein
MSRTEHIEDPRAPEASPAPVAPGRNAPHPAQFGWAAWRQILGRVYSNAGRHHLSILAAGVAFFSFLAIFPALAAVVGLYGLIANPADVMANLSNIRPLMPPDAFGLIESQLQALLAVPQQRLGTAFVVAMLFALWTARAGVSALVEGLNIVYREIDDRNIILEFLASLALTTLLVVIACAALLATVALPTVLQFLDIDPLATHLATLGPLLILGGVVVFVIGGLYRYGPHRELARKRWVSVGAVAAASVWVLTSYLFTFYIANFANFNKTYGSLGAIAALMFWFYISAFVVLLGAELNAEMELQTTRDTTTGQARPMGERGAHVADNVA